MLTVTDCIPKGLTETEPDKLHTILKGPTLIHLPGKKKRPLFISVLQHGNEHTGLLAIQALLNEYYSRELPRSLSIFIGNVDAARYRLRRLDHQPDYNRIWNRGETPEHQMMEQVINEMERHQPYASIDIHNNTGLNPHYACTNRLDNRSLQLANMFSRTVVYFLKPEGVQSAAFARFCPSVTIECGRPGDPSGIDHALNYMQSCLRQSEIPDHPIADHDIDLFHTVAIVTIPKNISFGFGNTATDIQFIENLDRFNFSELPPNTCLGKLNNDHNIRFEVKDESGKEVRDKYFSFNNNEIRTKSPIMPSMLTLDAQIIRQDCLCYLMERLSTADDTGRK